MRIPDYNFRLATAASVGYLAHPKAVTFNEVDDLRAIIRVEMDFEIDAWVKKIVAHVKVSRPILDRLSQYQGLADRLKQAFQRAVKVVETGQHVHAENMIRLALEILDTEMAQSFRWQAKGIQLTPTNLDECPGGVYTVIVQRETAAPQRM